MLHILDGVVMSTDLADGSLTVNLGDRVKIEAENSVANVVAADVMACKSVVHVIDTVLY
jgi:uncharacterized surface protein with fasciclin (FAS1) repeats